jgi:hypothetical protein
MSARCVHCDSELTEHEVAMYTTGCERCESDMPRVGVDRVTAHADIVDQMREWVRINPSSLLYSRREILNKAIEEIERLRVEASRYAYERDKARQERDQAEHRAETYWKGAAEARAGAMKEQCAKVAEEMASSGYEVLNLRVVCACKDIAAAIRNLPDEEQQHTEEAAR